MLRSLILLVIFSIQFGQRDVVPAGSRVEYKTFQSKVLARELGWDSARVRSEVEAFRLEAREEGLELA